MASLPMTSLVLKIKCQLGDELRVLTVPANVSYVQLQLRLKEMYGFAVNMTFEDGDGDMISIKSQFEVDEAFNMFRRLSGANQSLRLYLSKAPLQSTEDEGMAGPGMLGEPDEPDGGLFDENGTPQPMEDYSDAIEYTRGSMLGSGAFGQVFSVLNARTGVIMAMKEIKLQMTSKNVEKDMAKLKEEIRTFSQHKHLHLVQYLGVQITDDSFNIFMEYVAGGSLATLLQHFGALSEPTVRNYTDQILRGLEFLHDNNIVHRDIKGANILIDNRGIVKLADFGAATRLESIASASMLKSVRGTPYWMAPEVIKQSGHGLKCDIWSVGCTIYEMLTGGPPWGHLEPMQALFRIGTTSQPPTIPGTMSIAASDLILTCLNQNPDDRPSVVDLFHHPFLTEPTLSSTATSSRNSYMSLN